MKVRDMIAELSKLDPDAVCVYTDGPDDDLYEHCGPQPGFVNDPIGPGWFVTNQSEDGRCKHPAVML